jgi:hypothetical protein
MMTGRSSRAGFQFEPLAHELLPAAGEVPGQPRPARVYHRASFQPRAVG